jgi:Right handed beta helix region/Putative metal-binding motif
MRLKEISGIYAIKKSISTKRFKAPLLSSIKTILIFLLLYQIFIPSFGFAEEKTFYATEDATIFEHAQDVIWGEQESLEIGEYELYQYNEWKTYTKATLIKFDLSEISGSTINSVKLVLACYNKTSSDPCPNINKVTSSWSESSVTWEYQPSLDSIPVADDCITERGEYELYSDDNLGTYDLARIVQDWVDDGSHNYGLYIDQESYFAEAWFRSKEYGDSSVWPKLIVNYSQPQAANMELEIYRISDESGTPHTSDPGIEVGTFESGETIRITLRARNNGSSNIDANWVLNLSPADDHTDVRYNSDPSSNNTNDKTIPADGQWYYYSFDWAIDGNDPTGIYDAVAAIRDGNNWDNVLDDTENGANTTSVGYSAWVNNVFNVVIYGTTVITHGYWFSLDYSLGDQLPDYTWMDSMAEAILMRIGKGRIWKYNSESESFILNEGADNDGENILIFDWASQSNKDCQGFSEAAGDALFAALLLGEQNGNWSLDHLHFIGHSRGAVVNSEVVERLIAIDRSVEHVTTLDPHDSGFAELITGYKIVCDDYDVNYYTIGEIGVVTWEGVVKADNYYSTDDCQEGIFELDGNYLNGSHNVLLDGRGTCESPNYSMIGHGKVHTWYHGTIDTDCDTNGTTEETNYIASDEWYGNPDQKNRDQDGFYYSRIGGGSFDSSVLSNLGSKATVQFDFEQEGIVNGNFERSFILIDEMFDFEIPGWGQHGGGGTGHVDSGHLRLGINNTWREHNLFYIPSDAQKISYKYRTFWADSGTSPDVDRLEVWIGNPIDASYDIVDTVWLNEWMWEYIDTPRTFDVSEYAGSVRTIRFTIIKGGAVYNSEVWIDDVALVLSPIVHVLPLTPDPESPYNGEEIQALTPSFEWEPFQNGGDGETQAGYQLRVRCDTDGDVVVYDTGFVSDTSNHIHTYSPGTYDGADPETGSEMISQDLEWGKEYHWHVRYRDSGGDWSAWSADDPNPHQKFSTCVAYSYYKDADGDEYGNSSDITQACSQPLNYVSNSDDCDDSNENINPGVEEVCNGADDNCDGQTDGENSQGCTTYYKDSDGDGYGVTGDSRCLCSADGNYSATVDGDCDDSNENINPGVEEVCNGADDNCDGQVDEGVTTTYYQDLDSDGYGDPGITTQACMLPDGFVPNGSDNCINHYNPDQNDTDGDNFGDACDTCYTDPDKTEPGVCGCDTADTDADGDGVPHCNDECDSNPDKTEPGICGCDMADTDADGDGVPHCNDECDSNPDKTEPGVCGCDTADTDSDGDGTPDCIELIWYVNGSVENSGSGSSWNQAFKTITEAINAADENHEIWVKGGNYPLSSRIEVRKAIAIYGGFSGNETLKSERDLSNNVTTIDGQGSGDCISVYTTATIEGFVITGAGSGDYDFGVAIESGGDLTLTRSRIENNGDTGIVSFGVLEIKNCIVSGNNNRGVSLSTGSNSKVINCTIVGNKNGIHMVGTDPEALLINNIVTFNTGYGICDFSISDTAIVEIFNNNVFENGTNYTSGLIADTDISTDPLFDNTEDGNYRITALSPCIDVGTNQENNDIDFEGDERPYGAGYDIGVDEYNPNNMDSDGDGVTDFKDGCSNDASKIEPGICGCEAAETDTDSDGKPDCIDTDDDNDGMIDDWEISFELNSLENDAKDDPDGDGFTNIREYRLGTDPTDPNSYPEIKAMPWIPLLLLDDE